MKALICLIVAPLTLGSMLGCTTLQTMQHPSTQLIKRHIGAGDEVTVVTKRGARLALNITRIDDDSLLGMSQSDHKTYKVPFTAIETIEYRSTSTPRTAAFLAGTAIALLVIVVSTMDLDLAAGE